MSSGEEADDGDAAPGVLGYYQVHPTPALPTPHALAFVSATIDG